jgi:type VI secretion system protein ImpM
MPAGLFGKLPAKRDFIAANIPRGFLEVWEGWLQAGVATSKQMLGASWGEAYNRAPIWRFWLGAGIFGEATIGVFMPSVDGVGRAFPLSVFVGEGDQSLEPPELEPNDAWCDAAEAALLGALEPGATFEAVAAEVAALPPPVLQAKSVEAPGFSTLSDGGVVGRGAERRFALAFLASRRFGHRAAFASQSFWWTVGGEGFAPIALSQIGLPPPTRFADLLTGAFEDAAPAPARGTP